MLNRLIKRILVTPFIQSFLYCVFMGIGGSRYLSPIFFYIYEQRNNIRGFN